MKGFLNQRLQCKWNDSEDNNQSTLRLLLQLLVYYKLLKLLFDIGKLGLGYWDREGLGVQRVNIR